MNGINNSKSYGYNKNLKSMISEILAGKKGLK